MNLQRYNSFLPAPTIITRMGRLVIIARVFPDGLGGSGSLG